MGAALLHLRVQRSAKAHYIVREEGFSALARRR
jgi:hypothetical protein